MRKVIVLAAAALNLAACSTQSLYGAGQAWQKQECSRMADAQERSRCMASASRSYEEYKRESDAQRSK
jgi:predicted small secreted protein